MSFVSSGVIEFAVDTFGDGLLFTSSFGAESGVLLHLWSRVARHLPVVFIDTGFLFPETLRYRDRQKDPRDIASELGVRYVLDGSVRRQASRLRIVSELVDAISSRTVWSERFDGADDEIFEFQDRITARISGTLEPKLYEAEAERALAKPTESLDAYECVLRARSLLYTLSAADFPQAGRHKCGRRTPETGGIGQQQREQGEEGERGQYERLSVRPLAQTDRR